MTEKLVSLLFLTCHLFANQCGEDNARKKKQGTILSTGSGTESTQSSISKSGNNASC